MASQQLSLLRRGFGDGGRKRLQRPRGLYATTRSRRRHGFTLVEVLTVVVIIGILIALLLPALQDVREASRRTACSNNMKQLALAVDVYHSTYQRFPTGGKNYGSCTETLPNNPKSSPISSMSGMVLLLPALEEQAVFDKLNLNQAFATMTASGTSGSSSLLEGGSASANAAVAGTILSPLLCPSEKPESNKLLSGSFYGPASNRTGAKTNYDFSVTRTANAECNLWSSIARAERRIFGENSTTRGKDVIDGLSKTALLAEQTLAVNNGTCTAWAYRAHLHQGIDVGNSNFNTFGSSTVAYVRGRSIDQGLIGSLHPNGANFAFADGSVQFLMENMQASVRLNLARMADGSTVSF